MKVQQPGEQPHGLAYHENEYISRKLAYITKIKLVYITKIVMFQRFWLVTSVEEPDRQTLLSNNRYRYHDRVSQTTAYWSPGTADCWIARNSTAR